MHGILALWATPRSVSTAFEVMMRQRGDFHVLHEPFLSSYYHSRDRRVVADPDVPGDPTRDYAVIQGEILARAAETPVFFKDLAYHAHRGFEPWLVKVRHTFLIRDPALALPSLHAKMPNFSDEEYGMRELARLFDWSLELGQEPVIIDAADLVSDPHGVVTRYCTAVGIPFREDALEWEAKTRPEINAWEDGRWHDNLAKSRGFSKQSNEDYDDIDMNPRLRELYRESLPFYKRMHMLRLR